MAFLFKTPVALQGLGVVAVIAALTRESRRLRELIGAPIRALIVGAAVYAAVLMGSVSRVHTVGFRDALPVLPLLCVLIATGAATMWRTGTRTIRVVVAVLAASTVLSSLSDYPNFLAYISEYGLDRDRGSEVLIDSNLDWGRACRRVLDRSKRAP